jgi:hypothetical protein
MHTCRMKCSEIVLNIVGIFSLSLAVSNTAGGEIKVTTVSVPDGGQPVSAKTDSMGAIHLLFNSSSGPRYAKSTDNGKTFSQVIPVVNEPQKSGLEFTAWDMAIGQEGCIHVAMGTNAWKLKLPKEEWAYFYARLDFGAEAFSPPLNINHSPSEGFSLATDDKGNVTACWLSGKLYANVSHDNGKTFAPAVEIDPSIDPCDCCTTSSVYGADGKLAVLYREETENKRDMFLVLWDQVRSEVTRTRVSSTLWKIAACPMSYYAITRSQDGFVAVWPTKGQIYFARLDGRDAVQAPTEIKTSGTTSMRNGMLALSAANGNTMVVWKKDGQLNWQVYDQRGQPTGLAASARSAGNGVAGVLDNDGAFVLFR